MGDQGQELNLEDLSGVQDAAGVGDEADDTEDSEDELNDDLEGDSEAGNQDDDPGTRNTAAEKRIQGLVAENAKNKKALERERNKSKALESRQADMEARLVSIEGGGSEIPEPDDEAPADEWREYNRKIQTKQQQDFDKKLTEERMATRQAIAELRYDGRDGEPVFKDMLEKWSDTIFADDGLKTRMGNATNGHLEFGKIALELESAEAKELGIDNTGGGGDDGAGDDDMTDDDKDKKPDKPTGRTNPASRGTAPAKNQTDKTLKEQYRQVIKTLKRDPYGSFKEFKRYTEDGNRIRAKRAAGGAE